MFSKPARPGASTPGDGVLVERREIKLGGDGEVMPVRFELAPKQAGRETLTLRVESPVGDRNAADNHREADVEIVDRKNRVLLFSGGPMREYQFLRNLLHRDASTTVDVLLQSARPGISQDAHAVLDSFPTTREEMFQYDCVVAMDPDWESLTAEQIDLLDTWVADQGGGLVLIAGPVNMGNPIGGWLEDERMSKIRALYPVTFQRRFSVEASNVIAKEPWPLDFTREGNEAEFLWLGDDARGESPGVVRVPRRLQRLSRARRETGGLGFRAIRRPPRGGRRSAARLHGHAVLRRRTRVLLGQRRDVAAANDRRDVFREVLHEAAPPRVARAVASRFNAGHALGRARSLSLGRFGRDSRATDQCTA